jgi:hypothetical protein
LSGSETSIIVDHHHLSDDLGVALVATGLLMVDETRCPVRAHPVLINPFDHSPYLVIARHPSAQTVNILPER